MVVPGPAPPIRLLRRRRALKRSNAQLNDMNRLLILGSVGLLLGQAAAADKPVPRTHRLEVTPATVAYGY